ncbi:MAG: S49 family peptidase [Bacillus subtilis]|nr:S49 family peptidase [Bacillus subtilis]
MMNSGDKIALITLDGMISSESTGGFVRDIYSAESVKKSLKKASEDDSVKGVLLKINSPGGTVGMSQEIYRTILRLRKEKPVVVSMSDLAASGGYYIASR